MRRAIASTRQKKRSVGLFGYRMGQKIEGEPDGESADSLSYKFIIRNVPAPFTALRLDYTLNAGICAIIAFVDTGGYDAQFSKLLAMLADKYGEPAYMDEEGLYWRNVNVDDIDTIQLPTEPAHTPETPIVIYFFTNYRDSQAKAEAMCQNRDSQAKAEAMRQKKGGAGPFG